MRVIRQPVVSVHIDELRRSVAPVKYQVETTARWSEIEPSGRPVAVPRLKSAIEF